MTRAAVHLLGAGLVAAGLVLLVVAGPGLPLLVVGAVVLAIGLARSTNVG